MSNERKNYDVNYQTGLISFLLSDAISFARVRNILRKDYFHASLHSAVAFILDYSDAHKSLPIPEQIKQMTNHDFSLVADPTSREEWLLKETEEFCRHRAIENVVISGPDMVANGSYGEIERLIKEAMTISLITDLGDDLFTTAKARIERLKNRENIIDTGWQVINKKLHGGYTKGSLNIFAGGSGSGKSLFLQNQALNWALMGLNVIYITLELSQDLVNNRLDSMMTGMSTKEIFAKSNEVCYKIEKLRQEVKPGMLVTKKFPEGGTTCNDLRAYLKEFQIKTGIKPDAICIDYMDLLFPNSGKVDAANAFVKDKYVSEEMRAIGTEWDIPVVSASQLNRQSVGEQEFDHSHIAGGISKINTADNVFGIFTSQSMRENGKYRLQFLKTRSSSAVGSQIDLAYDPNCMRITDPDDMDERSDEEIAEAKKVNQSIGGQAAAVAVAPKSDQVRNDLEDLFNKLKK